MAELDDSSGLNANSSSSMNTISSVLAAAVMRRISLPSFISTSATANSIKIDAIKLGDTTVDRIDVVDAKTEVDTGTVTMENARAIVSLRLTFNFGLHIRMPWGIPDIDIDRSIPIGTIPSFNFDIGDISIPALNNIELDIPSATLDDIQASLEPVNNLDLGGASFNGLKLDNTVLPTAGFGLGGMSLGVLNLSEVSIPAISSARLSVDEFSPDNPLLLPSICINNIELPSTSAPRVTSDGPVVVPGVTSGSQRIGLTGGFLEANIDIAPTLNIAISSMAINNISAISTISKIDLRDLQSTVQVTGITVDGLQLNNVELESVSTAG